MSQGRRQQKGLFRRLAEWFESQQRILPWREELTPYRVWIAEIMLQQTQVATVIPFYNRFLARFPDVESLASADLDEVLIYWSGLGYYSRARNLHKGAKIVHQEGRFPQTREEWLKIPGIGRYTAGAILSIAYNQPEPILDGNVERVLSRVNCIGGETAEVNKRLWQTSEEWVKRADREGIEPRNFNQALMELGATLCLPKKPLCLLCPIQENCKAYRLTAIDAYPQKLKRPASVQLREEVFCLVDGKGRILLSKRGVGEWREGLWDFPIDLPEGLLEEHSAEKAGEMESRHVVTHHKIIRRTVVWKIQISGDDCPLPNDYRWVSPGESFASGSPVKKILRQLAEQWPDFFQKKVNFQRIKS